MNVGVNFSALDDERRRQEHLLRELREIEAELTTPSMRKTNLPHLASVVGVELDQNTRCLHYLTGISELERYVSDVAAHFAGRSIELSDPQALHKNIFTYKTLTDNVKSCWEYVDQLATLAQIHMKTSAEYHQFYHEANEVEAKLKKQLKLAQRRHQLVAQPRSPSDASKIANELREQLDAMRSLWNRSVSLVQRSESVVPMRLRLGGVSKGSACKGGGPVIVQALVSLTGPDYRIQQGELLSLVDNQQDTHLWKVQTSTGIVEVPSICFWIMDNDKEATERASVLKRQCKKTWMEIVRLSRERLYRDYIDILEQLASEDAYCPKPEPLVDLIADIQNHLITPIGEDGRLASALEAFKQNITTMRQGTGDDVILLKEADLVRLRSPLLRFQDHLVAVGLMQEEVRRLNERIASFVSEATSEQSRIANTIEKLTRITTESQAHLTDLVTNLSEMMDDSPKRPRPIHPKLQLADRSRSQPKATEHDDAETRGVLKERASRKRARSQTAHHLDAMVQIGRESKTVETQFQESSSSTELSCKTMRTWLSHDKAVQLNTRRPPVQRCVITQIGPSSKESSTQVESSSSLEVSMEEDFYMSERMKGVVRRRGGAVEEIGGEREQRTRSVSTRLQRPTVVQVHTCTQLGHITSDRSVSPIRALLTLCPSCQSSGQWGNQAEYEQLVCGSEFRFPFTHGEIQSEVHGLRQCKRVQCGFPCLTTKCNLYCQVNARGPPIGNFDVEAQALQCHVDVGITELACEVEQEAFHEMQPHLSRGQVINKRIQTGGPRLSSLVDSYTQAGKVYARARRLDVMTTERESIPVAFDDTAVDATIATTRHRNVRLQSGHANISDMISNATMIERMQRAGIRPPVTEDATTEGGWLTSSKAFRHRQADAPQLTDMREARMPRRATYTSNKPHRLGVRADLSTRRRRNRHKKGLLSTPPIERSAEAYDGSVQRYQEPSRFVVPRREQDENLDAKPEKESRYTTYPAAVPATLPTDVTSVLLQAQSLPNILGESEQSLDPTGASADRYQMYEPSKRSRQTATKDNTRYASLQSVAPALASSKTNRMHSGVVPNSALASSKTNRMHSGVVPNSGESDGQVDQGSNVRIVPSSRPVIQEKRSHARTIGSGSNMPYPNVQSIEPTDSPLNLASKKLLTMQHIQISETQTRSLPVCEPGITTETYKYPISKFSVQVGDKAPGIGIAEISQSVEAPREVGIAEAQSIRIVEHGNKKFQVNIDVGLPVRRCPVETPATVRYDVSCDAMIKNPQVSAKVQTEFLEEPIALKPTYEPRMYSEPPAARRPTEVGVQIEKPTEVMSTQFVPSMFGKKLQAKPIMTDASCGPLPPPPCAVATCQRSPETNGKKLQVTIEVPQVLERIRVTVPQKMKPTHEKSTQAELTQPLACGHSQTIEEAETIMVTTPTVQFAAPPTSFEDFSCDAQEPVKTAGAYTQTSAPSTLANATAQVGKREDISEERVAKKLQVKPEALAVGASQAIWSEPEPIVIKAPTPQPVVMSAPPVDTNEFSCDPLPVDTLGKKLQVMPEPLSTTISQTAFTPTQLAVSTGQSMYTEPKTTTYRSSTAQSRPLETVGKKLQVAPKALAVGASQAIWSEPEPIVIKAPTPQPVVMSAPP
ncbi:unnamed protein product, partial [Mesocestoides corti]